MCGVVRVISNLQTNSHLVFFHSLESFFDNIREVFLLVFFRVRNIEQVLQLASVIPVFIQRNAIMLTIIIKLKKKQQIKVVLNLLRQASVGCAEAIVFVLKAKPQSSVVDADDSIDLNPRDSVTCKV